MIGLVLLMQFLPRLLHRGAQPLGHRADLALKTSVANPRVWLEYALIHLGPG